MSQYKPYPAYKDSGVEWLGWVPEHWDTQRIRSLIDSAQNGIWGDDPDGGADDIPCARVADFDRNNFTVKGELPTLRKVPEAQRLSRQVNSGDLLIEKSGGGEQTTVGVVVQYLGADPVICSNFVAVVKSKKGVLPRWLCYTNAHLYSIGINVRSIKQTTGIQNIDSDQYFSERVAVPPESECRAIAAHLDRETARIDALIEKKTRFIELLREKRQALITHAVTKGPDPSVKMKDSSVEWLGEVPEHWVVKRLKWIATVQTGIAKGKDNAEKDTVEVPYLRVANVQDGYLDLDEVATIEVSPADLPRYLLQPGDVLMNEGGDFDKLGRGHVWHGEIEPCIHQNHVFAVRPHGVSSEWLSTFASSAAAQFYFMGRSKQSTNLASISSSNLMELVVPLPCEEEQHLILDGLDRQITKVDALGTMTERSIALLKERRSALITAAVTGQIDLRETV